MSLYRTLLREEAARALRDANTLAGPNVWTARSWPLKPDALPAIQLQVLADHAESWGRNAPGFTRTAGLLVVARISFGVPSEGENLLDAFCEQIELTLMQDTALQQMIQQVATIETEQAFDSTAGVNVATARLRFDLEYGEVFEPSGVPLTEINLAIANEAGAQLASSTVLLPKT